MQRSQNTIAQATMALQVLALALALSALTQLVLLATRFSHDARFLTLLSDNAGLGWLATGLWALALLARHTFDREGTRALLLPGKFGLAMAALLANACLPFVNAYFTHFTHPMLALCLVWVLWPGLLRLHARLATVWRARFAVANNRHAGPWLLAALTFALVFAQSYRRHYWFGSGGKDLGLFHQSVWLLSQFESPFNTVMGLHAFGDHIELVDLAAAPLQWLWPSAGALLLFQALLVGLGVVPVYAMARRALRSELAGVALALVFVCGIDMQNAVMFDWNPTTCGVALMPWVAYTHDKKPLWPFVLSVLGVALAKENLVLYVAGLCVALALEHRRRRYAKRAWLAVAALAVLFVVEMTLVFPLFREGGFRHLRFEELGQTPGDIAWAVLRSPYRALSLLLTPGRKIDGVLAPLSTVAFVCLVSPRYLVALLPMLLERFWSTHANRWWGFHYGCGAAVVTTLAAIPSLRRLNLLLWRHGLLRSLRGAGVALVLTSALLVSTLGRFGPGPLFVWWQPYYTTQEDRADAAAIVAQVPPDATVAAQNHLLPHLSARRDIVEITRPIRAEVVALDLVQSAWPFDAQYPRVLAAELLTQGYGVTACHGAALLLRRGATSVPCPALTQVAPASR